MNGRELSEVALFTDRADELKRFYALLLARAPESEWPGGAMHTSGGVTILIHERGEGAEHGPANRDHIAFAVDDLVGVCAELRAQGIAPQIEAAEYPWGRSAYLLDPDGRLVELSQR